MSAFFAFISFVSLIFLIGGLIKPELFIRWGEKRNRKEVLKYFGSALIISFILSIISISGSPSKAEDYKYPYHFVDSKDQLSGKGKWKDTMDLYYCTEPIDLAQLKEFCKYKRDKFSSEGTYYLVIFDEKENAVFPKDLLGAGFALEEGVSKHIKAHYTYRKWNGYSKLSYSEGGKLREEKF